MLIHSLRDFQVSDEKKSLLEKVTRFFDKFMENAKQFCLDSFRNDIFFSPELQDVLTRFRWHSAQPLLRSTANCTASILDPLQRCDECIANASCASDRRARAMEQINN